MAFKTDQHDDVKEWVLAVSVDKQLERVLLKDKRNVYEASLLNADGSMAEACIVTGFGIASLHFELKWLNKTFM